MESRANLRVQRKAKKVVIIGAGRIGQALAPMLEAGLVKVIDKDRKRCEAMAQAPEGFVLPVTAQTWISSPPRASARQTPSSVSPRTNG